MVQKWHEKCGPIIYSKWDSHLWPFYDIIYFHTRVSKEQLSPRQSRINVMECVNNVDERGRPTPISRWGCGIYIHRAGRWQGCIPGANTMHYIVEKDLHQSRNAPLPSVSLNVKSSNSHRTFKRVSTGHVTNWTIYIKWHSTSWNWTTRFQHLQRTISLTTLLQNGIISWTTRDFANPFTTAVEKLFDTVQAFIFFISYTIAMWVSTAKYVFEAKSFKTHLLSMEDRSPDV